MAQINQNARRVKFNRISRYKAIKLTDKEYMYLTKAVSFSEEGFIDKSCFGLRTLAAMGLIKRVSKKGNKIKWRLADKGDMEYEYIEIGNR